MTEPLISRITCYKWHELETFLANKRAVRATWYHTRMLYYSAQKLEIKYLHSHMIHPEMHFYLEQFYIGLEEANNALLIILQLILVENKRINIFIQTCARTHSLNTDRERIYLMLASKYI